MIGIRIEKIIIQKCSNCIIIYPCYYRNLVGSKNVMVTDDVHFGNSRNFLSVEELENVVKITSIEPRIVHLKNLQVLWEEVLKNSDLPTSDEQTQVTLLKKNFYVNKLKSFESELSLLS